MSVDHLFLFPDTNGLLHYPPITDVDWPTVCDAKQVTLVFCMQVIDELDDKKSDPRLADRASRVIKDITRVMSNQNEVRSNVRLEVFKHELRSEDLANPLSPDSGDDRIVHLVKKYIEKTGAKDVAVYSEDLGMSLRCEAYGIRVIEPDKGKRLENPQTKRDKEYKAAITRLNELENQAPILDVRVTDPDADPNVQDIWRIEISKQIEQVDLDVATQMEKERLLEEAYPQTLGSPEPDEILLEAVDEYIGAAKAERQRYDREVATYLDNYRAYAEAMNALAETFARSFEFTIYVVNTGTCPAKDVNVVLTFPPNLQSISCGQEACGERPVVPEQPDPPKPPRRGLAWPAGISLATPDLSDGLDVINDDLPAITPVGAPWSEIGGNKNDGFVINLHVPKLSHHRPETFGTFMGVFDNWDNVKSFGIDVSIMADNLNEKILKRIDCVVRAES